MSFKFTNLLFEECLFPSTLSEEGLQEGAAVCCYRDQIASHSVKASDLSLAFPPILGLRLFSSMFPLPVFHRYPWEPDSLR